MKPTEKLFLAVLILTCFSQSGILAAMPEGIRPLGMGGAFLAVGDDYHSVFYNPAGIIGFSERTISYIYDYETLEDTYRVILVSPDEGAGSFALTWQEKSGDRLGIFSYALGMGKAFSWGVNYKYIREEVSAAEEEENSRGTGLGWDLGVLLRLNENFSIGLAVYDLGDTEIEQDDLFGERREEEMRLGLAIRSLENTLLTLDFREGAEGGKNVSMGLEIKDGDSAVRVGIKEGELTAGLGYTIGGFQIDYAYEKVDEEESESLVSVAAKF